MSVQTKKWLVSAVAAATLALSAGAANALEVSGTLDAATLPGLGPVGLDVLTLSFTSGSFLLTVQGSATSTLFSSPSNSFVGYTSSMGLPGAYTYLYSGLTGTYKLSLLGSAGASYTVGILGTGSVTLVPEPESMALALAGLGVLGLLGRRRLTAASARG